MPIPLLETWRLVSGPPHHPYNYYELLSWFSSPPNGILQKIYLYLYIYLSISFDLYLSILVFFLFSSSSSSSSSHLALSLLVGSYEFDAGAVYELEGHELYRKWVALTDRSGKVSGIQGYLKLSITVLGPRDPSPAHDEKEEEDEENSGTDLQSMVCLSYFIFIYIYLISLIHPIYISIYLNGYLYCSFLYWFESFPSILFCSTPFYPLSLCRFSFLPQSKLKCKVWISESIEQNISLRWMHVSCLSIHLSIYLINNINNISIHLLLSLLVGKCDGYVSVLFGGNPEIRTEVIKKSYEPAWLELLSIPVQTPTMADLIKFKVCDWDQVSCYTYYTYISTSRKSIYLSISGPSSYSPSSTITPPPPPSINCLLAGNERRNSSNSSLEIQPGRWVQTTPLGQSIRYSRLRKRLHSRQSGRSGSQDERRLSRRVELSRESVD